MKKIILASALLFLSLSSSNVWAEWVRIYGNDKMDAYADSGTIRKKGNITRVYTLFDFRNENVLKEGGAYQSIVRETEFNCKQNQQRMLSFTIFSGKMGKGRIVETGEETQDWKTVSREQVAKDMKQFACRAEQ
jgi:hypothetical protein